jgi:uncharacterized membrane protein
MTTFLLGLVGFLGIHSIAIVAPGWRARIVERIGAVAWRAAYSVGSLAAFLVMIHGYGVARQSPVVLYTPPTALRHVAMLLMLPAFTMLLAAYLPGRIKARLKHPMLAAVKLWALAHLLANGTLAEVLLFGGFLAWAVADRISVGRRPARPAADATSGRYNDAIAVVGGLALYVVFVAWAHGRLIGVPLMP